MFEGFWKIIPVDPAEAMSSYSALGFIILGIICFCLFKQNCSLKADLLKKEKELKEHTNDEANKLHKKIEKSLDNHSNDLKDLKGMVIRLDKTMVSFTTDMKYMTKTIDEVKCTIETLRKK